MGSERRRELVARMDSELPIHVTQVVLDRLGTEEKRRGSLTRGLPLGEETRDLQLLRREVVERARVAAASGLARGRKLRASLLGPRARAERFEHPQSLAQLLARSDALPRTSEARAASQARDSALESVGRQRMEPQRFREHPIGRDTVLGEQRTATQRACERPWLPLRLGRRDESLGKGRSVRTAPQ